MRTAPASDRPRFALLIGTLMLIIFVAQIAALMSGSYGPIQSIDDWWRSTVGQQHGSIESNPAVLVFQFLGKTLVSSVLSTLIPVVFLILRKWWTALYSFVILAFSGTIMNLALKVLIRRNRPVESAAQGLSGPLFGESGTDSSPSGHTSLMVALFFIILVATVGKARVLGGTISGLAVVGMVLERTMVNAHWLSDTIGGILGVGAVGFLMWWLLEPRISTERRKISSH